jgi:Fe-S cluster assembly ATPase SufC
LKEILKGINLEVKAGEVHSIGQMVLEKSHFLPSLQETKTTVTMEEIALGRRRYFKNWLQKKERIKGVFLSISCGNSWSFVTNFIKTSINETKRKQRKRRHASERNAEINS